MSFTLEIKKEILSQEFSTQQALEFLSGIAACSSTKIKSKSILKINKQDISSQIRDMLEQMNISHKKDPKNKNYIILENFEPHREIKQPSYFFSGIFVGGGSISDPSSTSYHLELQFADGELSSKVKSYLNKYNFDFSQIKRRKNWILYIKKSEMLTDFLRVIQAFNSLMTFEDARIKRDFKNQLNRYSNLDTYNQNKLARATSDFIVWYKMIKTNNLESSFRTQELDFFEIKKNNPYSSLEELTKKYFKKTGIKKTRAGLNHYIYKLKRVLSNNDIDF